METNLMQCAAYGLSTDRLTFHPFNLQQCWQHSYVYFPKTTFGYDAEHMHSPSLVDQSLSGTCPVKPLYESWQSS
ncbi:unnamed protein product, partial [Staurois parvus]